MKLIAIRIVGIILLILSFNMILGGGWASVEQNIAFETHQQGKQAIITITEAYQQLGLKDAEQKNNFDILFDQFKEDLLNYNTNYLTNSRMMPYVFSAFALLLSIPYFIAGLGTLRLKKWSQKSGILAAALWPLFYIYALMTSITHLKFIDKIAQESYKLFSYIQLDENPMENINIFSQSAPTLIFLSLLLLILFTVFPIWFFTSPIIDEELS